MPITALSTRFASKCLSLLALYTTFVLALPCCADHRTPQGKAMGSTRSLPPPDTNASPLMQTLKKRRTSREFSSQPLDSNLLSSLLWAAYGVNRSDGKRTAPSAHDWQYIDVYVADAVGFYRYNARDHALDLVRLGDVRAQTGYQDLAAKAPVSLVLVCDQRKFPPEVSPQDQLLFGAVTSGAIAENVYLFAAANNLDAGVRSDIDRPKLGQTIGLAPEQRIIVALSVGHVPATAAIKAGLRSLLGRE
jgi:nitroreductase